MRPHANSHLNQEAHHLYEIYDTLEETVFKYGILCEPLSEDGSSPRANKQVREFNRIVGYLRFSASVLLTNIPGRKQAEEVEEEIVHLFALKYGVRPRGNPEKKTRN